MIDKTTLHSLHSYSNRPYKFRRENKGLIKKLIFFIIIVAVLYFAYSLIFSQNIAVNALKKGQELQNQAKIEDARDQYLKSAKKAKKDSDTFNSAIIGLWQTDDKNDAYDLSKEAIDKGQNKVINTYVQILISDGKKDDAKEKQADFDEITKISYQTFFANQISSESQLYKDLVTKLNSSYNLDSKKVILAQYLNQNNLPHFGTEIAKKVTEKDKNYRDGFLALGYGYLKNHNLELAKTTLLSAIDLDPVHPDTYKILAMAYKDLGETNNYKSCLDKAKELENK